MLWRKLCPLPHSRTEFFLVGGGISKSFFLRYNQITVIFVVCSMKRCNHSCATCLGNKFNCTTCPAASSMRITSPVDGSCPCLSGYYDVADNSQCQVLIASPLGEPSSSCHRLRQPCSSCHLLMVHHKKGFFLFVEFLHYSLPISAIAWGNTSFSDRLSNSVHPLAFNFLILWLR